MYGNRRKENKENLVEECVREIIINHGIGMYVCMYPHLARLVGLVCVFKITAKNINK